MSDRLDPFDCRLDKIMSPYMLSDDPMGCESIGKRDIGLCVGLNMELHGIVGTQVQCAVARLLIKKKQVTYVHSFGSSVNSIRSLYTEFQRLLTCISVFLIHRADL
jgi:hypothetical protein